ncbi:MAG: encapsulin [Pseudonocardiaceae bacterium]
MPHDVTRLPWTDEQWAMVQRTVQENARKARVASSFLPLFGPLPDGQASVPALAMRYPELEPYRGEAPKRLEVDDGQTLRLTTIACNVYLKTQQVEDPDLASAKQMLSRAADVIGRLEDAIVFNGQPGEDTPPADTGGIPEVYTVRGGQQQAGLLSDNGLECAVTVSLPRASEDLVRAVIDGIQCLERRGHYGPFACVLGRTLYEAASTPSPNSLVLPSDRITPFLDGGPLRRSSVVPDEQGVVVALAGSPIDLVVACDVHVSFVQLTLEPRYVLRVSERFVLRMKQADARCRLTAVQPDQKSKAAT